jgi:uncharacterized protein (DUF2235 family)
MKKLIVCCDGTWQRANQENPTNVKKIMDALKSDDAQEERYGDRVIYKDDPKGQIIYYDRGVGTGFGFDRISGGAFGRGINKNIKQAYEFLVDNYEPGDEIYLFGFSRGAYTVRSLAGMIYNCGLLTTDHKSRLNEAFRRYRSRRGVKRPKADASKEFRRNYTHDESDKKRTKVKFLGVFDTVGALGIPTEPLRPLFRRWYAFHDTRLNKCIEHAYHALAVDERRSPFIPTLWETHEETTSEQRWFVGCHADIGGGNPQVGLSDIALGWMLRSAQTAGLVCNDNVNVEQLGLVKSDQQIHDSYVGIARCLGMERRHVCVTKDEAPGAIAGNVEHTYGGVRQSSWFISLGKHRTYRHTTRDCDYANTIKDLVVDDSVVVWHEAQPEYNPESMHSALKQELFSCVEVTPK